MINLWFLVPFVYAMRMDVQVQEESGGCLQPTGAYIMQMFYTFFKGNGNSVPLVTTNDLPMAMGTALIGGVIIYIFYVINRKKYELDNGVYEKLGNVTCCFAIISILFSLEIFPWDELNNISTVIANIFAKIQFPWRFVCIGMAFAAFTSAIGLCYLKKHSKVIYSVMLVVLLYTTFLSVSYYFMELGNECTAYIVNSIDDTGEFEIGLNEYGLKGTDIDLCYDKSLQVTSDNLKILGYRLENDRYYINCENLSSEGYEKVIIPVFFYKGYKAFDIYGNELYIESANNRKIMINIPTNYSGQITVKYCEGFIWRLSEIVSAISIIVIVVLSFYQVFPNTKKAKHN